MSWLLSLAAQCVHIVLMLLAAPTAAGLLDLVESRLTGRSAASWRGHWQELGRLPKLQLAEVDRALSDYRPQRHNFPKISVYDLRERMRRDEVLLLDVRPAVEFKAGHLPGAVSIPLDELEQRLEELPLDKLIVAYCRGPWCVLSFEAVALLRERGYRVRRLEDGFPEWKMAGLPVGPGP